MYSHKELSAAFDLVKNPIHWKDPINALIPANKREVVCKAIKYFTATKAKFFPTKNPDLLRVKSIGYRNGPAGDH